MTRTRRPFLFGLVVTALGCGACTHIFLTPQDRRCFENHLLEAIELNNQREPLYAERSDGASVLVSERLIAAERAMLPMAAVLDRIDVEVGTTGLCEMFEPMANAAAYRASAPAIAEDYVPADVEAMESELRRALEDESPEQVAARADAMIERLERQPHYHCMLRHMLESVRRAANVTTRHQHAVAAGRSTDSADLYTGFISLHLDGLSSAGDLDIDAAALQKQGIAIICDDVPPIPPWPRPARHRARR